MECNGSCGNCNNHIEPLNDYDTDLVREAYQILIRSKQIHEEMTDEEKKRIDELANSLLGEEI